MHTLLRQLVAPALAILVLSLLAFFLLRANHASVMKNNLIQLDDRLDVVDRMIERWQSNQLRNVQMVAALESMRNWSAGQLRGVPDTPAEQAALQRLSELYTSLGYRGHLLFSKQLDLLDGVAGAPLRPEDFPHLHESLLRAQSEGTALSPAFRVPEALQHLYPDPHGYLQMVCASVGKSGVEGVLCLHAERRQGLAPVLNNLNSSSFSTVTLIDRSGQQLSAPWGLVEVGEKPASVFDGYREGYRNSYGEEVAGLLRWCERLQAGLLVEQPMAQLYGAYRQSRDLIVGLTTFACLLIILLSLLAQRHRRRLAESQSLYHQVLDHLPLLVRVRTPEGRCLLENRVSRESRSLPHGDLPLNQAEPPVGLDPFSRAVWLTLRNVLQDGQASEHKIDNGDIRDANFQALGLMGFPIHDTNGRFLALGSLAIHETEQVRSRLALQALTGNLEQQVQQRTMELAHARDVAESATRAKAQFLANMSHEIRSPLNAVIGLAHLAERCNQNPQVDTYLQRILHSAQHLQEVVNGILDYSKLDAGKLQIERVMFAPARVLESVADILWEKARSKQLEMIFDLDPRLPRSLYGDPLRIAQILLNLAENAIKFTSEGMVAIRVQLDEQRGTGWRLRFEVQDSGIGIPAERLEEIFKPFEQLDSSTCRQFGGTGLGLAICAQLVELMGGRMEARSRPNAGSLFRFYLDLDGAPAEQQLPLRSLSRRVLLVDSNPQSAEALDEMLAALGMHTERAVSMGQACRLLQQAHDSGQHYSLLLLDRELLAMQPEDLLASAREQQLLSHCRVILLTAPGSAPPLSDLVLEDYDVILDKPVSPQRLRETVLRLEQNDDFVALQGCHVLLVENEHINQDVARELLENLSVRVSLSDNGATALARLAEDPSIELVLMDVQMPVMDGLEATRRLRPLYPTLPVIAMTASGLEGDRERCLAAGMNDYLAKPIQPAMLAQKLLYWLRLPHSSEASPRLPEPSTTAPARLDRGGALGRLLDNEQLYGELLQRFVSHYAGSVEQIRLALAEGDRAIAVDIAHRFKSVAATIGAEQLAALTRQLEEQLRDEASCEVSLEALASELAWLLQQLGSEEPV